LSSQTMWQMNGAGVNRHTHPNPIISLNARPPTARALPLKTGLRHAPVGSSVIRLPQVRSGAKGGNVAFWRRTIAIHGHTPAAGGHIRHRSARAVTHHVDRHELGLFERRDMLAFMREAGLRAHFEPQGLMPDRGLYIAVKG
jgi:hypothetical protein